MRDDDIQDTRRVLRLKRAVSFRRPRSWYFHQRWGGADRRRRTGDVQPGAWLLDLGPRQVWFGGQDDQVEYLYRLAGGDVIARECLLEEDEVEEVADPQAIAAMRAYRSLDEFLIEELGITLERLCPGLPPFALIKCPLCGGTEFGSVELASSWCERCLAQFHLRMTGGDPGWVVDVTWRHVRSLEVRYLLPPAESLSLSMVLKNTDDPRDMRHEPDGCCRGWGAQEKCRPDALRLTGPEDSLRPGLHKCRLGDVYGWKLTGRIPAPREVGDARAWTIEDDTWPWSATLPARVLSEY
jgi:hypothetical protein